MGYVESIKRDLLTSTIYDEWGFCNPQSLTPDWILEKNERQARNDLKPIWLQSAGNFLTGVKRQPEKIEPNL